MVEINVATVLKRLSDAGFRLTKTRRRVVELILTSDSPLNAIELGELLMQKGLKVNKTTIYRELDFLVKRGIIKEVQIIPEIKHFESAGKEHHHHLICRDCGKIEKFVDHGMEAEITKVEKMIKERGFIVKEHLLEFYGKCGQCK